MCESGGGGGGGGGGEGSVEVLHDVRTSEPSLVANSISTQISYAGSNVAYACRKQNGRLYYSGKERKNVFIFFILFYLTGQ